MKYYFLCLLSILMMCGLCSPLSAQTPGGVRSGLTAWFNAEAGTTLSPANTLTAWANQVANPNLASLVAGGGPTTIVSNNPVPFNFHNYLQHNQGCMYFPNSVTNIDIVTTTQGSMMGAGSEADQLISLAGNATFQLFGVNRANSGIRGGRTEFGSGVVNGGVNFAAGTTLNTGNANVFGLRAMVGASPEQENTCNGLKATGVAATRPGGSYRFAVGSFIGYFYGNDKSAEVICHNRQLTATEFSKVESYLAIKYGVTLGTPATPVNYLSSGSTIVWPGDATYQNNITGIGRDDSSGLIQRQSKAVTAGSKIYIYNGNTAGVFPAMNVDNTTTFSADTSFVVFGDNNGDTTLSVCAMEGKAVRMGRHWKMVKTGTVGDITLSFTATALPAAVTTLLVAADNTFPEAGTTVIPLNNSGGLKYATIPSGNFFFAFAATPLNISVDVDKIVCNSTTGGTMTANVTGGLPPFSYSWNTTPPQATQTAVDVPAGNYTLTVTQGAGCSYSSLATMQSEKVELTADLTATGVLCNGENNGSIVVNSTNGAPAFSYSLNNENSWGSGNQFNNLYGGFYTVYMKDANGCTGKDTITVYEPGLLVVKASVIDDHCELGKAPNGNVELAITGGTPPYTAQLNGSTVEPAPKLSGLAANKYNYAVTDANGCKANADFSVAHVPCCLVFLPSAFTPNADGRNDVLQVQSTGEIRLNRLTVYNRYGQVVFNAFDLSKGWDGTMNNAPVDVGTYFYELKYTCNSFYGPKLESLKGDVTLIR